MSKSNDNSTLDHRPLADMTAAQCRELANHYKSLAQLPGISTDRAFILKNIARSLAGLASQLDRLAVLMRDEAK